MSELVLLVDDEKDLLSTLEYNFEQAGYATRAALSGQQALELARREPLPDLILLDLMLPDISGLDVCRALRADPRTRAIPVLMLTAKAEEVDRVVGFEIGADDYVVKPFSVRELLLRARAVLRRVHPPAVDALEGTQRFGRLRLDPAAHRVWVDEGEIHLTAIEFKLIALLLARRGRVQSRDQLLSDVWGIDAELHTRTVDTHVTRLRHKLGRAGEYIETIRGVGYRLRANPDEETA